MSECMQTCQKFQKSRGPYVSDINTMNSFVDRVSEIFYKPGTREYYFNALGAIWMSMTDENEEGKWLDWYTKEVC